MLKPKALLFSSMTATAVLISPGLAATPAIAASGNHPGYMQALSDLREAHAMLTQQSSDAKVYDGEKKALSEVDAAIGEIKSASIDDGKSVSDYPKVDVTEHGSRLLRSVEVLHKAQADIRGEGDKPDVKELRVKANHDIDLAIQSAYAAHQEWVKDNKK